MKHTIKLLTLAFMLAAILTLTGCPGPVNTVVPCTHENKKTVIETAATCTETGLEKIICADCGELIEENNIEALGHDFGEWTVTKEATCTADGEETRTCKREGCTHSETRPIKAHHSWDDGTVNKEATCTEDGEKTYKCSRCDETKTENIPAHHTFIAGGCDAPNCPKHYYYNGADDYQIKAYVYSSEEDALNDKNERVLYFSFPNDTTGIPQIVIGKNGPEITINNLIQMKSGYAEKTVKYFSFYSDDFLQDIKEKHEYPNESIPLTDLENKDLSNNNSPIYIVV